MMAHWRMTAAAFPLDSCASQHLLQVHKIQPSLA